MQMIEVESSQLAKIGWAKGKGLHVLFKGGNHVYRYPDVPEEIFKELENAQSIGSAFNVKVKGIYSHTKHEIEKA